MCGSLEHAQPPYFYLQLPCLSVCVNGSTEGNCKEDLCHLWLADLYAPKEFIWERVAPSHTGMTQLSDWPELH